MNPRATDVDDLLVLHDDVDREAGRLALRHRERLLCRRGCVDCCVDDLTVFEVEADRIRRNHPMLLAEGEAHPTGACAFLDPRGSCRIYDDRPYVCRTQGLPLCWLEERGGETVELRDICALNDLANEPVETLPVDACWTIGPFEGRLANLQTRRTEGAGKRVALRLLFHPR